MENGQSNFTTIIHKVRLDLGLSCNEYCIADIIFCLSASPANRYGGWCYASKETLGRFLGVSKQSVHSIINRLLVLDLIEKDGDTKHLRATQRWYDCVVAPRIGQGKETLPTVKELGLVNSKETLLEGSKESLHNNNSIDNNKDTAFEKFYASYPGKRKDRKNSERSWKKINPKEYEQIFTALEAYKASKEWQDQGGQFIPYTSKWLNQERWKDELPAPPPKQAFYKGMKMKEVDGKLKVWDRGQWNDYGGKLSEIEWK